MSWKTGGSRGDAVVLATALASGCLSAGSMVTTSATATTTEGSGATEASDSATTTTEATQGMSSTSVGSSASTTTSTSMSTSTSTSAGESTTTGCTFLCADVDHGAQECDMWTQNCPEGEKCMPWANDNGGAWNSSKCSPIDSIRSCIRPS